MALHDDATPADVAGAARSAVTHASESAAGDADWLDILGELDAPLGRRAWLVSIAAAAISACSAHDPTAPKKHKPTDPPGTEPPGPGEPPAPPSGEPGAPPPEPQDPPGPRTIAFTPDRGSLAQGTTLPFLLTVRDQDGAPAPGVVVTLISSAPERVSVTPASGTTDADGKLIVSASGLAVGSASLFATTGKRVAGAAAVTVTPPASADVAALIAALGGDALVDACYCPWESASLEMSGTGVARMHDVRGDAFGPPIAMNTGTGAALPRVDAVEHTLVFNGVNFGETPASPKFAATAKGTWVAIGYFPMSDDDINASTCLQLYYPTDPAFGDVARPPVLFKLHTPNAQGDIVFRGGFDHQQGCAYITGESIPASEACRVILFGIASSVGGKFMRMLDAKDSADAPHAFVADPMALRLGNQSVGITHAYPRFGLLVRVREYPLPESKVAAVRSWAAAHFPVKLAGSGQEKDLSPPDRALITALGGDGAVAAIWVPKHDYTRSHGAGGPAVHSLADLRGSDVNAWPMYLIQNDPARRPVYDPRTGRLVFEAPGAFLESWQADPRLTLDGPVTIVLGAAIPTPPAGGAATTALALAEAPRAQRGLLLEALPSAQGGFYRARTTRGGSATAAAPRTPGARLYLLGQRAAAGTTIEAPNAAERTAGAATPYEPAGANLLTLNAAVGGGGPRAGMELEFLIVVRENPLTPEHRAALLAWVAAEHPAVGVL